jgi:hypothetical protein
MLTRLLFVIVVFPCSLCPLSSCFICVHFFCSTTVVSFGFALEHYSHSRRSLRFSISASRFSGHFPTTNETIIGCSNDTNLEFDLSAVLNHTLEECGHSLTITTTSSRIVQLNPRHPTKSSHLTPVSAGIALLLLSRFSLRSLRIRTSLIRTLRTSSLPLLRYDVPSAGKLNDALLVYAGPGADVVLHHYSSTMILCEMEGWL